MQHFHQYAFQDIYLTISNAISAKTKEIAFKQFSKTKLLFTSTPYMNNIVTNLRTCPFSCKSPIGIVLISSSSHVCVCLSICLCLCLCLCLYNSSLCLYISLAWLHSPWEEGGGGFGWYLNSDVCVWGMQIEGDEGDDDGNLFVMFFCWS